MLLKVCVVMFDKEAIITYLAKWKKDFLLYSASLAASLRPIQEEGSCLRWGKSSTSRMEA